MIAEAVVERVLTSAFGEPVTVTGRGALGGGHICRVVRIDTSAGPFVVKSAAEAPPGFFGAEAAGLEAIGRARSGFVVPRVVAIGPEAAVGGNVPPFLILEYLAPDTASRRHDEDIGRSLAMLHRTGHDGFGFDLDTFCGPTRQENRWRPSWIEFYAAARLEPQVAAAVEARLLDDGEHRRLSRVIARLDAYLTEPPEGGALIHGDLWSGNLHATTGGAPALLDPAVSFSHREAELGMMSLFGGFTRATFDAYADAWPLDAGWRDRQPLYQLYHLLNHLNLFGRVYHEAVVAIARRFA